MLVNNLASVCGGERQSDRVRREVRGLTRMDFPIDVKALAELLKSPKDEDSSSSSSDDDLPQSGMAKLGPGSIGSKISISTSKKEYNYSQRLEPKASDDPKSIRRDDELELQSISDNASFDPREEPTYDIVYQQSVTPEDIYLQMGRKTPSTASCEAMILKINLEGEDASEISCDAKQQHLDVQSPRYRLSLPLPHPVHPKICKALWNGASSQLIVTLFLNRELDYVNF